MLVVIILFFIGLVILLGGAKLLVLGASQLASTFGISSLVIGLTIVSFGTSTPEIAISIVGTWKGEGGLVVGNIVGSNIFNILIALGFCATLTPLVVKRQLIRWDIPCMIGATLLFWLFAANKEISRLEGIILFIGVILYSIFVFLMLKKNPPQEKAPSSHHSIWLQILWIIIGSILLSVGSELLVENAKKIALYLGISELFVGLTIVAIGTSLPELATALVALRKGENDLAVGNVVGSNIFNLLAVVGIAGTISPHPIEVPAKAYTFDIPIMVGVAIATLPIFLTGHRISRWEGVLFLFYYLLYILFLFLETYSAPFLPYFTWAFFFFILPLTILSLGVGVFRHFKQKKR